MALLEILTYQDPALRSKTEEIDHITPEIKNLVRDMSETMEAAYGVGLAAPQVGRLIRLFVYDIGDGPKAVINPRIIRTAGEEVGNEGCLSIPRLLGDVPRAVKLTVAWLDENGKRHKRTVEGFQARVFQHENDHLYGILFTDKALPGSLRMSDDNLNEREAQIA
ncbi:MAG TPA: peptide deformylase [Armatimonadota bacterium]|jgi:peptide deformylase